MIRLGRSLALPLGAAAALVLLSLASAASAREVLTPEEQAERELEAKRQAAPVLVVEPEKIAATVRTDESAAFPLTIRNGGGRVLRWTIPSAPAWLRFDVRSGELRFGEKRKLFVTVAGERLLGETGAEPVEGRIMIEAEGAEGSPRYLQVRLVVEQIEQIEQVAPASPQPAGERLRYSAAFGPMFTPFEEIKMSSQITVEARKGVNAAVVGYRPFGRDYYKPRPDFEASFGEELRIRYRRYSGSGANWAWYWELGASMLAIDLEMFGNSTGPAEGTYAAAGAGIRLGRRVFIDLSFDVLVGGPEKELSLWDGPVEVTHRLESDYAVFNLALGFTF